MGWCFNLLSAWFPSRIKTLKLANKPHGDYNIKKYIMKNSLVSFFSFFLLLACRESPQRPSPNPIPQAANQGEKVSFELVEYKKSVGNCKEKNRCAKVALTIPLVKEGNQRVKNSLNQIILSAVSEALVFAPNEQVTSFAMLKTQADTFLAQWEKSAASDPEEMESGWVVNVKGKAKLQTDKVAVVTLEIYSYAGGAHPNSYVNIFNLDIHSGKQLKWPDIARDVELLEKLAEKKFKESRGLSSKDNLGDNGYFHGLPFTLPENFELEKEGILFWYNPYEAAAYEEGPIKFFISFKELENAVKKDQLF